MTDSGEEPGTLATRPAPPPAPWRWTDAILVLLLSALGAALLQPVIGLLRLGPYGDALMLLLIAALTGAVTWGLVRRRYGDLVWLLLGHRRPTPGDVGAGLGAALVGVAGVTAIVYVLTLSGSPPDVQGELRAVASNPATLPIMVLAAVVVIPIAEELLYRGLLFQALRTRLGRWPAMGLSGLVFGLLHAQDTFAGTLLLLAAFYPFGMWLAWLFDRRGSLLAPVICHMTYNGVNLALFLSGR